MSAPALCPTSGCGLLVDLEGEVLERAAQHHAVVALGALEAHVLVEHVVEHGLRLTVEWAAPTAATAVVVHDPLRRPDRHPLGRVLHVERVLRAVPDLHL